ncbi:response regulator [bacterium]|nr:response regulator [bacterium]
MRDKNIVIVDDDASILELFHDVLEGAGFKVQIFMRGWEALQAVSRERPDLVILDIMMPRVNGFEVCQILKENPKTRSIPVIFLTALSHQEALRRAAEGGADDFLVKPCTPEKLIKHVNRYLEKETETEGETTS